MPVTIEVLERRWRKLQEAMAAAGLDVLVLAGRGVIGQFGYVVYLCGYTPVLRASYAVLRREGRPILFVPSRIDEALVRERGAIEDVRSSGEADAVPGVPTAEAVGAEVRQGRPRRVGLAGFGQIVSAGDYLVFQRELDGLELVDATGLVAAVKARKDAWELEQVRAALALAQRAYRAAPELVREGARAQEVVAELERILRARGGSEVLVFVDSSPHFVRRTSGTVFRRGDLVTLLVEVANEDGFWVEQGGLLALGDPGPRARRLAAACYRALDSIRALVAPGVPVARASAALEEIGRAEGFQLGLGLGHGIGVDHDLPLLQASASALFEEGQVLSVHPHYQDPESGAGGVVADAFHVTEAGCEQLSALRYELTVLDR